MIHADWGETQRERFSSDEHGVLVAGTHLDLSYPEGGNADCFALEADSFWFRHRNAAIQELLRRFPPPGTPLLDIGGGNGIVASAIESLGIRTVLLEPGRQGTINAVRRGLKTVILGTLQDLNLADGVVPAAGMFDVLEHIERDVSFLRELRRVLSVGARLYLSVPANQALWSTDDVAAGHYRRYTINSLGNVLRESGFAAEYRSYLFAPLLLPLFVFRTLPSLVGVRRLDNQANEHRRKSRIIDFLLDAERARIARGGIIPFGTSVLAVARAV